MVASVTDGAQNTGTATQTLTITGPGEPAGPYALTADTSTHVLPAVAQEAAERIASLLAAVTLS